MPLEEYAGTYYSEKVDVWSIGAIAYLILTGKEAFQDKNGMQQLMNDIKEFDEKKNPKIFEEQEFTRLDQDIKEFIRDCLKKNPLERKSCTDLLSSKWMEKLHEDLVIDITKPDSHG